MRNLLKYLTVSIFLIPSVLFSIPVSELIAPLTALKVYPPNGGGGGSTIVTASTPIVSTEVTGGYNISCPTCTTGSLLAYQQAFGVPPAGSISGGPYVSIGPTSDMHFTYGTGLTFTSANLIGKIYQYLDNNYIWHFSPYLNSPMNGVQVDTGSSVILSDSTDTSKVKLKNNQGNLEVTGENGSIGTITTAGAIVAEKGAVFSDDVTMLAGKKTRYFNPNNTKLATTNLDASGNLNNLGANNYKYDAPILLTDPTNTYFGSISKKLLGGLVPAMSISSNNTIITGDDGASPGSFLLGYGSNINFQNSTNSSSTRVSLDDLGNLNFTGPTNYTFDSNLLIKNGTSLKLQSADQTAQSTLSTDDNHDLIATSQNEIKLIANENVEINASLILKNKDTDITLGVWNKDNGSLGIIDSETGLFSEYLSIKTVDGQSWLQIGDGNTTQPMAFNHNTNKNGVVYLDNDYRMITPVLLSGQALVGNTSDAPTPQNILLSTTPLNSIAAPTNDVSLNSKKITNLAKGISTGDAATVGQLQGYLPAETPLNNIAAPIANVSLNNYQINNLKPGILLSDSATVGQATKQLEKVYYVSTTGNDATATGSQSSPYSTVNKVISLIPVNNATNVTIYVAPGTYTENIVINKQRVDIIGMEAPSSQPKAVKFPSISITTTGSNAGDYVDNGVSISNITLTARTGLETYAISYTASNLFLSLNDVLISNNINIDGIVMNVADSSRLYINNSSINVLGTGVAMRFNRGELWDFRNSQATSTNGAALIANSNNVAIYSAINSTFSSTGIVLNFTGSNNKSIIAVFSQSLIQGAPIGGGGTNAMIQLGASFNLSLNNCSVTSLGGVAQIANPMIYLGSSSVLLATYNSISANATGSAAFVPIQSVAGNNSIFSYYGNVFLTSGGTNVYSKPVSGVGGFLIVSKMQTDS